MRPVSVAIIGAGHMGSYHAQKLARLHQEGAAIFTGVIDTNQEAAAILAKRYGVLAGGSISALAPKTDAVIIATPAKTHEAVACDALSHGMHVLLEKPLAHNTQSGRRIVAAAKKAACILQVGHNERFNPAVVASLRLVDHPRYIVTERLAPFSGRGHDIDVIFDLMIHDLEIIGSLTQAQPSEIRAIGVPVITEATDMAAVRLAFPGGLVAQLSAGRASLHPSRMMRFFTSNRYISTNCLTGSVKSIRRTKASTGDTWPEISAKSIETPMENTDTLYLQDRDFVRCIIQGSSPKIDGISGLRALTMAQAIKDAMTVPY